MIWKIINLFNKGEKPVEGLFRTVLDKTLDKILQNQSRRDLSLSFSFTCKLCSLRSSTAEGPVEFLSIRHYDLQLCCHSHVCPVLPAYHLTLLSLGLELQTHAQVWTLSKNLSTVSRKSNFLNCAFLEIDMYNHVVG